MKSLLLKIKNLILKIRLPVSILVGGVVCYLLFAYPLETYTLPIIIIWLPDIIGWSAFYVVLGILAGMATYGIMMFKEDEED